MINRLKELYLKYKEIINYLIVGGLTTVVSLVTYYACVLTFLDPNNPLQLQIANVISWIFAVAFAYVTNRKWVFHSQATGRKEITKEILSFYGCRVATGVVDWLCMFIFADLLHMNDLVIKLAANILVIILNYIASKLWIFRKAPEEKEEGT